MIRRSRLVPLTALGAVLVLAACTQSVAGRPLAQGASDPALAAAVAALPQRSLAAPPAMRLADGLVPPTNRWFSGLVFPVTPEAVFPLPLSVGVRDDGFGIGLPEVKAKEKTIFGSHTPAMDVALGSGRTIVAAYDEVTVTSAFLDAAGAERGRMLMARGSPYVRYTATAEQEITVTPGPAGGATVDVRGTRYGLVPAGGAEVADGGKVRMPAGGSVTLYAVPPGGDEKLLAEHAAVPVQGGAVNHRVDGERVIATMTYRTDGAATLAAAMPHQEVVDPDKKCDAGTYATVYGPMTMCATTTLEVSAPVVEPAGELDVGKLSAADRTAVEAALRNDVSSLKFIEPDTYYGGKELGRAANLLRLAEQLELTELADGLRSSLVTELRRWTEPDGCSSRPTHCFVYDATMRGIVGLKNTFESEKFNDHHFHYGYFLYAAAIVAKDDPALASDLAPVIDLLAADIGADRATAEFPRHRAFDAFVGHSWAAGYGAFGDGNNQESSSESVTAYNGLAMWAQLRKNDSLYEQAVAMLSREAAAARLYWVTPPLDSKEFDDYERKVLGINWGGKRDFATWFSPDPSAVLGIQLIPMSPVAGYLAGDPGRIKANITEAAPDGFKVKFGDFLLMYLALADKKAARAGFDTYPGEIDPGNSKAYMLAWIATR